MRRLLALGSALLLGTLIAGSAAVAATGDLYGPYYVGSFDYDIDNDGQQRSYEFYCDSPETPVDVLMGTTAFVYDSGGGFPTASNPGKPVAVQMMTGPAGYAIGARVHMVANTSPAPDLVLRVTLSCAHVRT